MNALIAYFSQWPLVAILFPIIVIIFLVIFIRKRVQGQGSRASSSHQLYVGNLPYSLNETQLKEVFSVYGRIDSLRIIKQSRTNRSKGFGFIAFKTAKEAKQALSAHGTTLKGRVLVVRIAKQKDS